MPTPPPSATIGRRPERPIPRPFLLALSIALAVASGCVRVYQPMSGLHRPVVVDPRLENFPDLRLTVYCAPGGLLNRAEAGMLCRRVGTLFENQGAKVTTYTRYRGEPEGGEGEQAAEAEPATDLTLELRARKVHETNNQLSWLLCIASFTLVPGVSEQTFAQDIVIRDATGFLLVSDSLEGRIVRRFGVGTWAGNGILDLFFRAKEDELTPAAMGRDLSYDLYRQLSQLVFNAKMRWEVLQEAGAGGAP